MKEGYYWIKHNDRIHVDALPQDCLRLYGFFISVINKSKLFQEVVCSFNDFL